jgi:hypothetical protein
VVDVPGLPRRIICEQRGVHGVHAVRVGVRHDAAGSTIGFGFFEWNKECIYVYTCTCSCVTSDGLSVSGPSWRRG